MSQRRDTMGSWTDSGADEFSFVLCASCQPTGGDRGCDRSKLLKHDAGAQTQMLSRTDGVRPIHPAAAMCSPTGADRGSKVLYQSPGSRWRNPSPPGGRFSAFATALIVGGGRREQQLLELFRERHSARVHGFRALVFSGREERRARAAASIVAGTARPRIRNGGVRYGKNERPSTDILRLSARDDRFPRFVLNRQIWMNRREESLFPFPLRPLLSLSAVLSFFLMGSLVSGGHSIFA